VLDKARTVDIFKKSLEAEGFKFEGETGYRGAFVEAVRKAFENSLMPRSFTDPQRVLDALWAASWVRDGFDDNEIRAATLIFLAYADSLSRFQEDDPTSDFVAIIRDKLFGWTHLPETGTRLVMAHATNTLDATLALQLTSEQLPAIEEFIGAYTWSYVFIRVTQDVPETGDGFAVAPYVRIKPEALSTRVLPRELARATFSVYVDAWIREGFTEAAGAFATGRVEEVRAEAQSILEEAGQPARANLDFKGIWYQPTAVERAQLIIFMLGVTEAIGVDGLGRLTRVFRGSSFQDPSILLIRQADTDAEREAIQEVFCRHTTEQHFCPSE
jgi:hypothetical protein